MILLLLGANDVRIALSNDQSAVQELDFISSLIDTMNNLVITYVGVLNPNILYLVLTDLLIKSQAEEVPPKFNGLIIKLMVKLLKNIENHKEDLDLQQIFQRMNMYLFEIESAQNLSDLGFKVIKTFVKNYCNSCDEEKVRKAYKIAVVIGNRQGQDRISRWIEIVLQSYEQNRQKNQSQHQNHNSNGTTATQSQSQSQGDRYVEQLVEKLKNANIGSFPKITQELYQVLCKYPEVNLDRHLQELSSSHAKYVSKELQRHKEKEKEQQQFSQKHHLQPNAYSSIHRKTSQNDDTGNSFNNSQSNYSSNYSNRKINTKNPDISNKLEQLRAKMNNFSEKKN